jgi:hypothetical protein
LYKNAIKFLKTLKCGGEKMYLDSKLVPLDLKGTANPLTYPTKKKKKQGIVGTYTYLLVLRIIVGINIEIAKINIRERKKPKQEEIGEEKTIKNIGGIKGKERSKNRSNIYF